MIERFQRHLFDIPRLEQPLSIKMQRLLHTILASRDLIDDDRIRQLTLMRSNPAGDWLCTAALAFLDADGNEQPIHGMARRSDNPRHRG